jgi:hypothetical protein
MEERRQAVSALAELFFWRGDPVQPFGRDCNELCHALVWKRGVHDRWELGKMRSASLEPTLSCLSD